MLVVHHVFRPDTSLQILEVGAVLPLHASALGKAELAYLEDGVRDDLLGERFPKLTGRKMSTLLGHLHFWPSFLFINGVFGPMFIQGLAGVSRRLYDGGATYSHAQPVLEWNTFMSHSAWALGLAQIPFILNLFWSIKKGAKVGDNPWDATTLEWAAAPSPPVAHGNFHEIPTVVRGPYDYSLPGAPKDFVPQHQPTPQEA